jgi:phosphoenolpyruvate synthase/pyruvate phosphate dikinase
MIACPPMRSLKRGPPGAPQHAPMTAHSVPAGPDTQYIRHLDSLGLSDLPEVGGKAASLGELQRACAVLGVRVPPGFVVTARAYREMMAQQGLQQALDALLGPLDVTDPVALALAGTRARALVYDAPMPAAVEIALRDAWRALAQAQGGSVSVAVRSSATAEDLPGASFAGSTTASSPSRARTPSSTPCAAARPRSTPTGRSRTALPAASPMRASPSRWW